MFKLSWMLKYSKERIKKEKKKDTKVISTIYTLFPKLGAVEFERLVIA